MSLILLEGSFKQEDIPPYFYCAIVLDPFNIKRMEDLAQNKLMGLEGITSSFREANIFFSGKRNGFLTMAGTETIKANALSRVLYDNAHYLTSRNFAIFKRLMADDAEGNAISSYFNDVLVNLRQFAIKTGSELRPLLTAIATDGGKIAKLYQKFDSRINSLESLTKWFISALNVILPGKELGSKLPFEQILKSLSSIATLMMESLKSEKEWLVKNKVLTIPPQSSLKIAFGRESTKWDDQMKSVISQYNLAHIFHLGYVR
jgi:hypothetical protein